MSSININQTEARKELTNGRNDFIRYVFALAASDEECRLVIANLLGVFEGKVAQVVESLAEDIKWNLEFYC